MKTMNKRALKLTMMALALAAAYSHGAAAQEAKAGDPAKPAEAAKPANSADGAKADSGQLETVIVTAQRRSENIKDVPMAMSAIKGEKLDVLGSGGMDIRFLSARTPSLVAESTFGRTFPRFYIRGMGNIDFDLNASQPVGMVYDDVVLENPMLKGFPVFDVDQVEVLRGPQGTLFGRNSPAGVIKFESAKPGRKQEGYAVLGLGNYGLRTAEGMLNIPLGENWAARVSLLGQQRDDRVHNDRPGAPVKNFEGYEDHSARIQLLYKDKDFSALLNAHHRDMRGSAILFRANAIKKGTNELANGFDYFSYPSDGGNSQELHGTGASARLRWELDGITVHSITGYESIDVFSRGDIDGGYGCTPNPAAPWFCPVVVPYGPNGAIPFAAETADGMPYHRQLSQEVRVESNTKGPLQWIGGLYMFEEKITIETFNYDSIAKTQQGYALQHQHAKSWAAFGSLNYTVSDQLKLRGGLRYTDDKKDFDAIKVEDPFGGDPAGPFAKSPSSTNISWDLSGTYQLNKDTNLFARVATGYRAPSIQGRILFASPPLTNDSISVSNSEKALSFDVGIKQDLYNKRARMSASLFSYTVKDLQLTANHGAQNFTTMINADKVVGHGAEFDFLANVSDEWRVSFGGSYNFTEIRDPNLYVTNCGSGCTMTSPAGPFPGTSSINGNPLPRAPKWLGNMTLRYSRPVGDGELYAFTDWSYRGSMNFDLYEAKEYTSKPLVEGGLRLGYTWGDGKYELAGFVRNITNQRVIDGEIAVNNLTAIVNEPRTIGAQFKMNF
ncbi:MAG: TonB-dependent receptor [Pseudomonadota bacterium]